MHRRDFLAALGAVVAFGTPARAADGEDRTVAITFDDGPHPELTPRLLDMLEREQVCATFYVVGCCAERRPDIVRRAFAAGHEIGNHSWSHPFLTEISTERAAAEISRTDTLLQSLTGERPNTLRPPYGAMNPEIRELALPRPMMLWDVDTSDWRTRNTAAVERAAIASSGGIVLMHDIHPTTVAAVPAIIRSFKSRGYRFVTISAYVAWTLTDPAWLDRV